MELLKLLEDRVLDLIQQRQELREQMQYMQSTSSEAVSGYAALVEENRMLREELEAERRLKSDVLKRVDTLLDQLQDMENAV